MRWEQYWCRDYCQRFHFLIPWWEAMSIAWQAFVGNDNVPDWEGA